MNLKRTGVTRSMRNMALLVSAILLLSCSSTLQPSSLAPGSHTFEIDIAGRTRNYLLYLPSQAQLNAPRPLLLAFHGGGGNAARFREYAGIDHVADREGFAVVYPNGTGRHQSRLLTWNAGGCCGHAQQLRVDDVAFARAIVDDLAQRTPIDRDRVYATGHSNGAMMSYRLAAEDPALLAAIAPVGAAMNLHPFRAGEPMPVLHIHSVDDPRALYDGGLGPPFPFTNYRVQHRAAETELQRWVRLNRCAEASQLIEEREDKRTGHTARHYRFVPCHGNATIELWKLTGAGHGWPGSPVGRRLERWIGPGTDVIDAAEEVWRFVSRFERSSGSQGPQD